MLEAVYVGAEEVTFSKSGLSTQPSSEMDSSFPSSDVSVPLCSSTPIPVSNGVACSETVGIDVLWNALTRALDQNRCECVCVYCVCCVCACVYACVCSTFIHHRLFKSLLLVLCIYDSGALPSSILNFFDIFFSLSHMCRFCLETRSQNFAWEAVECYWRTLLVVHYLRAPWLMLLMHALWMGSFV